VSFYDANRIPPMPSEFHYSDYLQLDKILGAQEPESDKRGQPAHDEMLFIVIHQTYELWFKQLLHETESVIRIMQMPALDDNSPELQTIVHRLSRCATILGVLVHQIDIMETMNPMDFLDFRDMLRPASGFQSVQFKMLEARLGLKFEQRYGQQHYISQLREEEVERIRKAEKERSLLDLVGGWLERMPFFAETGNWENFASESSVVGNDVFWSEYRLRYQQSLAENEKGNLEAFDRIFFGEANSPANGTRRALSPEASRSALFIMLYRGYPILQLPHQVLHQLLEIDGQLSTWRWRHMSMVHRTIGTRIGTGGSTGRDYLKGALDSHSLFADIAALTSFLIERKRLPPLSPEMERRLGFLAR
jgi:tryptophan 2,3-dioxygenase